VATTVPFNLNFTVDPVGAVTVNLGVAVVMKPLPANVPVLLALSTAKPVGVAGAPVVALTVSVNAWVS
jgi:hypothetical protein